MKTFLLQDGGEGHFERQTQLVSLRRSSHCSRCSGKNWKESQRRSSKLLINIKLSLWKTWKPKNHNNVFWNIMSWVEVELWPLWYLNRFLVYKRVKTKQFLKNINPYELYEEVNKQTRKIILWQLLWFHILHILVIYQNVAFH